jgi:hypothetical protein
MDLDENNDDNFEYPKKSSKPNLSLTDIPETKKTKPLFITHNRFSPLSNDVTETATLTNDYTSNKDVPPVDFQDIKIKLPLPIFVCGILDFIGLHNELIKLIDADKFILKFSINGLKIQTSDSKSYRNIIHFLRDSEAQYHTYQPREDKAFRVVIRNLRPSTPTIKIGVAIEEIGFSSPTGYKRSSKND